MSETPEDRPEANDYDEFAFLPDVAAELGLAPSPIPKVQRQSVEVAPGQSLSLLRWGDAAPELVFLHGGGQNAHTWDAVLLALGRPALAIDLPGHGRSAWRPDRDYSPWANAEALARVLPHLAPEAKAVIGMSLVRRIRLTNSFFGTGKSNAEMISGRSVPHSGQSPA